MPKILYFENNPDHNKNISDLISKSLEQPCDSTFTSSSENTFEIIPVQQLQTSFKNLDSGEIDVVLLDLSLPDGEGIDAFKNIHANYPDIPVIVLSNKDDESLALKAVQMGAQDYLVKGQVNNQLLNRSIRYAIERQKLLTKLQKVHKVEHYLAYHDVLTNLPNRQLFYGHLNRATALAKRHQKKIAVLYLDLDGFKRINDTLGHDSGDLLLYSLAKRLKNTLRESDMVARIGGDEFVIILDDINQSQDAGHVAQKILEALSKPINLDNNEIYITTSIGISIYPLDGDEVDVLIKNADIAMYRAKSLGKNSYQHYNMSMISSSYPNPSFENELRHVIERNELIVHYQPQLDIQTGKITGLEALVRWRHPKYGLMYPDKFIKVAELIGTIEQIDEWVLKSACLQNKLWQEKGHLPIRISVNLSAKQFRKDKLTYTIEKTLEETGLEPQFLGLEITESKAMQDVEYTINVLKILKDMGIQLLVDDFGTGYSSLSYLKRFPIDVLKIDKSFIQDISNNSDDAAITSAIIGLAHNLQLKVIAEGVETKDQLNFLISQQCDEIQGFHYSKPLPPAQIEKMLPIHQAVLQEVPVSIIHTHNEK